MPFSTPNDWLVKFSDNSIANVSEHASVIKNAASFFGADPVAVAGAVAREATGVDNPNIYGTARTTAFQGFKDFILSEASTDPESFHLELVESHKSTNNVDARDFLLGEAGAAFTSPTIVDVGPGKIRIDIAINAIRAYAESVEGTPAGDPLDLLQYKDDYALLVRDLYEYNLTFKIAAFYIAQAENFFIESGVFNSEKFSSAAEQWESYSAELKSSNLIKYYTVGPRNLVEYVEEAGHRSYNPVGWGGNILLFQNNLDLIENALAVERAGNFEINIDAPDSIIINNSLGNEVKKGVDLELTRYELSESSPTGWFDGFLNIFRPESIDTTPLSLTGDIFGEFVVEEANKVKEFR